MPRPSGRRSISSERTPTKAEKEFLGDCYGELHDPVAPECKVCLVVGHCAAASALYHISQLDPTVPVRRPINPHVQEAGFVVFSGAWFAYKVVCARVGWPVMFDELFAEFQIRIKENAVHITDANKTLRRVLDILIARGVLTRQARNQYGRPIPL